MNTSSLPFRVSDNVAELITVIERGTGAEILLREAEFTQFNESSSVRGGFDNWVPHVTVNPSHRDEFDEHGLAHELLHLTRFLDGVPSLETPNTVAGVSSKDASVRKAFAVDVTSQIEHIAIFPRLVELGFDPHEQADRWKRRQIEALATGFEAPPGPVDFSWLAIKIGVSPFLGRSEDVQLKHRDAIDRLAPQVIGLGDEITALIKRFGVAKPYNVTRLYQQMLRAANIPKGALLLKVLDFRNRSETLDTVP